MAKGRKKKAPAKNRSGRWLLVMLAAALAMVTGAWIAILREDGVRLPGLLGFSSDGDDEAIEDTERRALDRILRREERDDRTSDD